MRISEDKRMKLYNALYDPIMDLRILVEKSRKHSVSISYKWIDNELFKLEGNIWNGIKRALNIVDESIE